jgi:hypothetical protein
MLPGKVIIPSQSAALYEARALAALGRTEELRTLIGESESFPSQSALIPALPPLRGLSPGFIMLEAGLELRAHGHPEESRAILNQAITWYRSRLESDPQSPRGIRLGSGFIATSILSRCATFRRFRN